MGHKVFAKSSDEPHLSTPSNVQCSGMKDASGIWVTIKAHVAKRGGDCRHPKHDREDRPHNDCSPMVCRIR